MYDRIENQRVIRRQKTDSYWNQSPDRQVGQKQSVSPAGEVMRE